MSEPFAVDAQTVATTSDNELFTALRELTGSSPSARRVLDQIRRFGNPPDAVRYVAEPFRPEVTTIGGSPGVGWHVRLEREMEGDKE